jgi:signal transduction histidine kinase
MTLQRRRWLVGLLAASIAAVLTAVPFRMWRHQKEDAIMSAFDTQLLKQMEEVLFSEVSGTPLPEWVISWRVNADEQWNEPLVPTDLEPPLYSWMREAGEWWAFRSYELDNSTGLRALVRPTRVNFGYVTMQYTGDRDAELAELRSNSWKMAAGLAAGCLAIGWIASVLSMRPVRRLLGDQQSFLADAAHEMRTPLAVILASSSQALAKDRTAEEYVRSLAEIRSAAERASTGVNEMLDLVRFESGQSIPRAAPLRLDLLAEEVAAAVRPEGVEVVAEPCDAIVVQGDMALLRQAVENVVRNAARRASRVELITTSERGDGVIEIVDNGPGFDAAILPRVFERYQRGDRKGEAGIGLAIVKAIAVAHGGSVVATNNLAGGATVRLRIPLAKLG